jgi:hypothetical protein
VEHECSRSLLTWWVLIEKVSRNLLVPGSTQSAGAWLKPRPKQKGAFLFVDWKQL